MADREKKRKRVSQAGGPPAKKVSFEGQSGTIQVKHLARDEQQPFVVGEFLRVCASIRYSFATASTPGLSIPTSIAFQSFHKPDQKSKAKHKETNGRSSKSELLLHSREHPAIDYTARDPPAGADAHLIKHYVAVYDPKTGDLQVVEAHKMDMRSSLRVEDEQLREKTRAKQENVSMRVKSFRGLMLTTTQGLTLRQELGMTFGTKKAKKAINSLSENAIAPQRARDASPGAAKKALKANPSALAVLESMEMSANNAPSTNDLQHNIDNAKPRPRHNPNAESPGEVYEVKSIVGDELMKELKVKPWVDAVEANEAVITQSRFVSHRLRALCENDEIVRLKVLKYMLHLLDFYNGLKTVRGGGRKLPEKGELEKKMGVEKHVFDTIRKRFTEGL